jgi:hypothetical protein
MRWRRRSGAGEDDGFGRVTADLFAGFLLAVLMLLVTVVLQTIEIRELRRVNDIFQHALKGVATSSADFEVREGRIVVKAESLFKQSSYEIDHGDADRRFGAARSALVEVLETVAKDLRDAPGGLDASTYVEVRVVGHSDCQPFPPASDFDNMDLSALRGVALVKYLTQPCSGTDDQFVCCSDGSATCSGERPSKRIDPRKWTILPSGRGSYEPRDLSGPEAELYRTSCQAVNPDLLQRQRRVVIELVPRIDKLLIK